MLFVTVFERETVSSEVPLELFRPPLICRTQFAQRTSNRTKLRRPMVHKHNSYQSTNSDSSGF